MCGIAGIAYRDREHRVPRRTVQVMCDAIRHRGPDDEGIAIRGSAGIGMRRLSIIDLAGGHQPILNEDGSLAIVFNGEIYNYRELRRGLVARGHCFTTHSDTETILHLFEEEGPACLDRLRGMFAFAIHDARDGSLFLARDRFGIKPLYVAEGPWGIAFASELRALLAAGASDRRLDWEALDLFLELGYIPAPWSPFTDVRKLEPGHWLRWHPDRGAEQRRYWDLPATAVHPVPRGVEDWVRDWLDDAVEAHLESDVPVAAFLSGGIDSSAIVSSMAWLTGRPPHAFTARYLGSGAEGTDETALARQLAGRWGAKLTVVDVHPDARELFEPIVRTLDEPHADESAIPSWLVSEAIAAEYKVALAGTGGDELFAGYRRHMGLLAGEYYRRLPTGAQRAVSGAAQRIPEPAGGSHAIDRVKRFLRPNANSAATRYLGYFSRLPWGERSALYAPEVRAKVTGAAAAAAFEQAHHAGGAPGGIRAGLYLDYKTYLPDDILALSDRIAMAHSLEVRVPFVDHVLVERVFPLPDSVKVGLFEPKRLLRRAVRSRLPAAHFHAPKRGFVGPTAAWLRNELRDVLVDELAPDRMRRLGFFDPVAVNRLVHEHLTRQQNRSAILWELLCLSTWHRLAAEPAAPGALVTVA